MKPMRRSCFDVKIVLDGSLPFLGMLYLYLNYKARVLSCTNTILVKTMHSHVTGFFESLLGF